MVLTLARAMGVPTMRVAEVLGMHRNRLYDKVNGRIKFTEQEIIALAEFFGVEPGHLFKDPRDLLGVGAAPAQPSATVGLAPWRLGQPRRSEGTNSSSVIRCAGLGVDLVNAA